MERLFSRAAMVRVKAPNTLNFGSLGRQFYSSEDGCIVLSASGILFDAPRGIIITSKTLLAPFLIPSSGSDSVAPQKSSAETSSESVLAPNVVIEVLLDESIMKGDLDTENEAQESPETRRRTFGRGANRRSKPIRNVTRRQTWFEATLMDTIKCPRIQLALDRVSSSGTHWTAGWPVTTESVGQLDESRAEAAALSYWSSYDEIVLLEIVQEGDEFSSQTSIGSDVSLNKPLLQSVVSVERGLPINFIGSPYGILAPNIFHNSIFSAIISNVVTAGRRHDHVVSPASAVSDKASKATNRSSQDIYTPPEADLLMIDQECQPGCEGGPVFDSSGDLIGMMLPPIRPTDGTNVQVQLVAPAAQFVHAVRARLRRQFGIDESEIIATVKQQSIKASNCVASEESLLLGAAISSVVLVSVGTYWASGVVVSPAGDIITSAHLFRPLLMSENPFQPVLKIGLRVDVRIDKPAQLSSPRPDSGRPSTIRTIQRKDASVKSGIGNASSLWLAAELLFVSDSHLDVAMLKLSSLPPIDFGSLRPISLARASSSSESSSSSLRKWPSPAMGSRDLQMAPPKKGDRVYVIGYSLFGPSKKLKATCTDGIISGLPRTRGQIQMIQTNCKVDKGASGGAVIDRTGNFLGLVTCNAVAKKGLVVSRINFSIPVNQLLPVFKYIQQRERHTLERLLVKDDEAAAMWKITQTSNPSIPPAMIKIQEKVLSEINKSTGANTTLRSRL